MSRIDKQIAGTEEKLKQLKARQQKTVARQRAIESQKARKTDTRRKILMGATVFARVKQGRLRQDEVRGWLNEALTRPDDRALFDLATPQTAPPEQIGLGLSKSP